MEKWLIYFLKGYRYLLSPFLGDCCRFYPCCSQYAIDAITSFGCVSGSFLAIRRLLKCHPWSEGGADPVPSEGFQKLHTK